MSNSTSITYQMKREILNFSNKISAKLSKPKRRFYSEMSYGMLASKSCLLTDITDQLHETSKKINVVYNETSQNRRMWINLRKPYGNSI